MLTESAETTGLSLFLLPLFSGTSRIKPKCSSSFASCWTDLKSLFKILASAYKEAGFSCFITCRMRAFSLFKSCLKAEISEKSNSFSFSPFKCLKKDVKASFDAFIVILIVLVFFAMVCLPKNRRRFANYYYLLYIF